MKYRYIIADVDGTLIPPAAHGSTVASPRVASAVQKAQEKKATFTLATARSLDWVEGLVQSLSIHAPLILDNGARIYDPSTSSYLRNLTLTKEQIHKVHEVYFKFTHEVVVVDERVRHVIHKLGEGTFHNATKTMLLHVSPTIAQQAYKSLTKIQGLAVSKSVSGANPTVESIHVTHPDATKRNALEWVIKRFGWKREEIVGIGDSYNDVDFLLGCGLKVAMGNAIDEVKKIADTVVADYQNDGVAEAIERFIVSS